MALIGDRAIPAERERKRLQHRMPKAEAEFLRDGEVRKQRIGMEDDAEPALDRLFLG